MNSSILQPLKIFILFFLTLQILYSNDTIELTSEEKIFIKQHPTIIFGADYNWPPYDFIDSKGHHTGIAADFLHLISQKSGLQFQVKPDIWDKTLQKIKNKSRQTGRTHMCCKNQTTRGLSSFYQTLPFYAIGHNNKNR